MIIYIILAVILIPLLIALIRAILMERKTASYTYSTDNERIDKYAKKLSEMVSFETISHRDKPEPEKFREYHKVLEKLFPDVFSLCEKTEIDGNLMLLWRGKDSSLQPIGLMSHQDVVEASGNWRFPPFSGTIAEDRIWGRGSGDTKCSAMAFYQAVEELISEGYEPECDIYLISSCTEEIGGDGAGKLANYLKEKGITLFMLCDEGGSMVLNPMAGIPGAFAAVGIFEKGYGDIKFIAKGTGGHSSSPAKDTPIPRLAKFIAQVEKRSPFKSKMLPAVEAMLSNIAPYSNKFIYRLMFGNLWLFKPILTKVMPSISAQAGAMLRTTIAFTMQNGSKGYNVIPNEAYVCANLRFIPHQGTNESINIITELAKKYDLETEVIYKGYPSEALDLNGVAYNMTKSAINKVFPQVGMMPYVVTGGTDCRFWGEVCSSCVRFSPMLYAPDQLSSMHGLDENVHSACLPGAVDYYKEIIKMQEERQK